MPNELQQAADGVKNLAKHYQSVMRLSEEIQKIGDLGAHRLELEKQRDAAMAERDSVIASLADAKTVSELQRARVKAQADLDALAARSNAERDALDIILAEQSTAKAKVKSLKSEAAEVEKQLASMRGEVDSLRKRFA